MAASPDVRSERRRRPKDRKEQIARVSADAFSELGYHGVSMEGIAGRVGVSAASLYRHYAGKYELFRDAVLALGNHLVECTAFVDEPDAPADDPVWTWDHLVTALIDTTLKNRTSGGLYRWEGRYLREEDQAILNDQIKLVNRRLQRPLSQLRPELRSRQRWTLSSSVLSVIGSITDHRAHLPDDQIHTFFARIAQDIRNTDLPNEEPTTDLLRSSSAGAAAGEYEHILHEALLLFHERGYRDTGMEDIAAAVNIPTTSLYKYFSGKGAILAAIYRRAADRVSGDMSTILATTDNPRDVVCECVDAYVRRSFDTPELAYVYYVERGNVPAPDRTAIHNIQRATIEAWVRQVAAARPDITEDQARFAVHAAFSLVVDLGRLMQYEHTSASHAVVCHLLRTTLLGPA
ncbi:TetR/AcrR family transcriptional regulator [Mycolicibacterium sp. 120270]|uniref:TetR/AcrR family transcriptional regulator n=1 Tax=Mycolicibacterium sp. 120270 TaxID=3090600 RepID=UPI00299E86D5|nr:TetR/AcrR family transcriptional regulator [Mycolicibacterium sp. 120270]MDX1884859.1 TetR/AcrR family transcriptional regulator [Mycolicibacterium sp. 120270]